MPRFHYGRRARALSAALIAAGFAAMLLLPQSGAIAGFWFSEKPLPEFQNQSPALWINSKPLKKADLAGSVVLIEVWTSV